MNHKLNRLPCACGCGTLVFRFRLVPCEDGPTVFGVLPEHLKKFHSKLRKRDEIREFLKNHDRGWLHRLAWAPSLFRLSRYAHGTKQAWISVLLFVSPVQLANWLAKRV